VNHLYRIAYRPRKNGKGLSPTLVKADNVETYQAGVTYIVRAARPSGWKPGRRIRLLYRYYLTRDADCDNLKKAMNDAIAAGLGVNDKVFLATDVLKETVKTDPRVEIEVVNEE
jgi:Holliday junction resolvase RusA-like endonuclease